MNILIKKHKTRYLAIGFTVLAAGCFAKESNRRETEKIATRAENLVNADRIANEPTLAILPFRNNTEDKAFDKTGEILVDIISSRLASQKRPMLVERHKIKEVLEELRLSHLGVVDPAEAARIGKMLGARWMIFGSLSKIGTRIIMAMRLVQVETSQIIDGNVQEIADISQIDAIAEKTVDKLTRSFR